MTDVITKLVNLWPASRIDQLMRWAYAAGRARHTLDAALSERTSWGAADRGQ